MKLQLQGILLSVIWLSSIVAAGGPEYPVDPALPDVNGNNVTDVPPHTPITEGPPHPTVNPASSTVIPPTPSSTTTTTSTTTTPPPPPTTKSTVVPTVNPPTTNPPTANPSTVNPPTVAPVTVAPSNGTTTTVAPSNGGGGSDDNPVGPEHVRHFDGPSFIGGIILAVGLASIAFVGFKFYRARTERNYHTL